MKALSFLAVLPFLALSYTPARAEAVIYADQLPWGDFTREYVAPEAATKLLVTLKVSKTPGTFHIPVTNCGNNIQAVELKVTGADVTVTGFGLKFTDGQSKDFPITKTFAAGTDSGWIDMSMLRQVDPRCPVDIYAKGSSSGNATILVYGQMK
jgi:hypothetical protein